MILCCQWNSRTKQRPRTSSVLWQQSPPAINDTAPVRAACLLLLRCGGIASLHCAPVLTRPVRSGRILCRSINSLKPIWFSSTMALKASIFWVQSSWVNRFGAWGGSWGPPWLQELKEPQVPNVPRRPAKLKFWLSSSCSSWVVIEAADALPIELKEGSSKKMSSILRVLCTFPILQESGPFVAESGAFAAPSHGEKQTHVFIIEKIRQWSPRHHSEMFGVAWLLASK